MASRLPDITEIANLVAFLPRLYASGFEPVIHWGGGTRDKDGVLMLPWPEYDPTVIEFFHLAGNECWLDCGYDPTRAREMLLAPGLVESASLEQIKTMLTFCTRGERFADGHWAAMIDEGHIRRLLERLEQLLATDPRQTDRPPAS